MPKEAIVISIGDEKVYIPKDELEENYPFEELLGYEDALKLENAIAEDLEDLDYIGCPVKH